MSQAYRVCAGAVQCESESESALEIISDIKGVIPIIQKQFLGAGWKEEGGLLKKQFDGVDVEVDLNKKVFRAHIEGDKDVWVTDRSASHKEALKKGRENLKKQLDTEIMKRDQKILAEIESNISAGEEEALIRLAQSQGTITEQSKSGGNFRLTVKA